MMKNDSTLLLLHANARGGLRRKKIKFSKILSFAIDELLYFFLF